MKISATSFAKDRLVFARTLVSFFVAFSGSFAWAQVPSEVPSAPPTAEDASVAEVPGQGNAPSESNVPTVDNVATPSNAPTADNAAIPSDALAADNAPTVTPPTAATPEIQPSNVAVTATGAERAEMPSGGLDLVGTGRVSDQVEMPPGDAAVTVAGSVVGQYDRLDLIRQAWILARGDDGYFSCGMKTALAPGLEQTYLDEYVQLMTSERLRIFRLLLSGSSSSSRACRNVINDLNAQYDRNHSSVSEYRVSSAETIALVAEQARRVNAMAQALQADHTAFLAAVAAAQQVRPGRARLSGNARIHAVDVADNALIAAINRVSGPAFAGFPASDGIAWAGLRYQITHENKVSLYSCMGIPLASAPRGFDMHCASYDLSTGRSRGADPASAHAYARTFREYRHHFTATELSQQDQSERDAMSREEWIESQLRAHPDARVRNCLNASPAAGAH